MDPTNALVKVQAYFDNLGLRSEDSAVYAKLIAAGPASALQVAKQTGVSRTQVYRSLERLQEYSLVSSERLTYGTLFRALPIQNIENQLASREMNIANLRQGLSDVAGALQQLADAAQMPTATVEHYYGMAGIKQANWNLLRAERSFYVIELSHITDHFEHSFGQRHRERVIERGLTTHDLTNATQVTKEELEPFNPSKTFYRHIDPKILTINFEVYIYNDVVTLLDYRPGQMHAIEVHHQAYHALMYQIYQALWRLGTPLSIS